MDDEYKPLQRLADKLQYRCRDCIGDGNDALARNLQQAGVDVREDIESNRAPRAVEARILGLERTLEQVKSRPTSAMSPDAAANLLQEYEGLRRQLRQLPHY